MATDPVQSDDWPDDEYIPYLEAEQRLYAWILCKVGGVAPEEAMSRAIARFHYEPQSERGVITNIGAWDIAMRDLFGRRRKPEEFGLEVEFDALKKRLFHGE